MTTFNIKAAVKAIESACGATAKRLIAATEKATVTRNAELGKLADAIRAKGVTAEHLKGNAKSNPIRATVKAFFDRLVEAGVIGKASGATYQTCFWLAYEKQVPFSTDLANQKTEAKKSNAGSGKAKDDAAKVKGSVVVKTSRENLLALLDQAQKMMHDLNLVAALPEFEMWRADFDLVTPAAAPAKKGKGK